MIIRDFDKLREHSNSEIWTLFMELSSSKQECAEIKISKTLGEPKDEKRYILKDFYFIKTNIGFSIFLELEREDEKFTFEMPHVTHINSELINPACVKYWFSCRNEHFNMTMPEYSNGKMNYKELIKEMGKEIGEFIFHHSFTTHRLFVYTKGN